MKKTIIPLFIIISMLAAGCANNEAAAGDTVDGAEAGIVEENTIPVETMKIKKASIDRKLVYAGQVKPVEQIMVMPKIGGKVIKANYDVGDRVSKGSVLFEIDDTDLRSQLSAAQAQYNATQAGVDTAETNLEAVSGAQIDSTVLQMQTAIENADLAVENSQIVVENSKLAVDNAKLTLDDVSKNFENTRALYAAGAIPRADFERVELSYNQALAGYEQAKNAAQQALVANNQARTARNQAVESYNLYVNKTQGSTIKQAQSGVNQASAAASASKVAVDNAARSLNDLRVQSPLSGVVIAKTVSVGSMAGPTSPAYTIINMDVIEINTSVSEELINSIKVGMEVPVTIKTVSDKPFTGRISTITPAAEEAKNTFPVKITINNSDGILKPGMFAEIQFVKEKSDSAIVVPRNTVLSDEESRYVFAEENGAAKKYVVETGIDNGSDIEILKGLPENANVIIKGQTQVADGEKVRVVN